LGLLAAALLATSGGCMTMTTETVPVGSPTQPVSQARAKRDLGIDYLSTRRTAMAIRELTSSLSLDPDDPETHLWLGEAYRRKGRTDEAETFLRDAIRLSESRESSETEQSARLNLSALLAQEGRYEESIEQCRILIADPTVSAPWRPLTNCGWANLQLGRLDEARTQLEEALEFFPRFGPALLNLGILMTKQGHPLKAIAMLERAIESGRLASTGIGEAHYRLGEIYVGLGRRDKAVVHFRAATDEAPHADWSEQSQAYLDLLN
jgi:Tfp pilus assembly protein PilF